MVSYGHQGGYQRPWLERHFDTLRNFCRLVANSLIGLVRCTLAMTRQEEEKEEDQWRFAGHDANDQNHKSLIF